MCVGYRKKLTYSEKRCPARYSKIFRAPTRNKNPTRVSAISHPVCKASTEPCFYSEKTTCQIGVKNILTFLEQSMAGSGGVPVEEFPISSLLPKKETQVENFLRKYPDYDGENILIAIFDSGIDPGAAGLKVRNFQPGAETVHVLVPCDPVVLFSYLARVILEKVSSSVQFPIRKRIRKQERQFVRYLATVYCNIKIKTVHVRFFQFYFQIYSVFAPLQHTQH